MTDTTHNVLDKVVDSVLAQLVNAHSCSDEEKKEKTLRKVSQRGREGEDIFCGFVLT